MSNLEMTPQNVRNIHQQNARNIHQRMLSVYEEVSSVQKEDKKVNNQYTFVSHDAVVKALRHSLVKNRIVTPVSTKSCTQDGNRTTVLLNVKFVNADTPEDLIEVDFYGYGIDPQDKGVGKAVSYAFKTALLKNFLLESSDEDNERSHTDYKPSTAPNKTPVYITPFQANELRLKIIQSGMSEDEFLKRSRIKELKCLEADRLDGALAYLNEMPKFAPETQLNGHSEGTMQ